MDRADLTRRDAGRERKSKATMTLDEIHVGSIVTGPLLPEPVEVLALISMGGPLGIIGSGRNVDRSRRRSTPTRRNPLDGSSVRLDSGACVWRFRPG